MTSCCKKLYEFEKILRHKEGKSGTLYYVKWKGYSKEYNSWEPQENFNPQDIEDYMESLKLNLLKKIKKSQEMLMQRKLEEESKRVALEEQKKRREQRKQQRNLRTEGVHISDCSTSM